MALFLYLKCFTIGVVSLNKEIIKSFRIGGNMAEYKPRALYGRKVIYTDLPQITNDNLIEELEKSYSTHLINRSDIQYLWDYYTGKQDILLRKKTIRPEINNRIVENRANEIVAFKVGYLAGEPIQYIARKPDDIIGNQISDLNEMMFAENKFAKDKEVIEWGMICGTAFRMVLPDNPLDEDDAPFEIYTLDPRNTFVVQSSRLGNKRVYGATYWLDEFNQPHFSVYTRDKHYKVDDWRITSVESHTLNDIPIFEYPANNARLGSFEIVLPLLNKINNLESNRMDGIEQVVQSFMKFINVDIDKGQMLEFLELGAIKINSSNQLPADVDVVKNELDQNQSQTIKNDTYESILTICGIPNRNGGSSTSDTGAAVMMRDGWTLAEARAKDSETMFKQSEQDFLKLVLRITNTLTDMDLRVKDIGMQFTRRNYEAIQSKAQVLVTMLQQDKIHPQLAFSHSGMFTDPEKAYMISMEYYKELGKQRLDEVKQLQQGDDLIDEQEM